jgi:hypothetical protein
MLVYSWLFNFMPLLHQLFGPLLCGDYWVCGFLFCVDAMGNISKMDNNLQEANHLVSEMCKKITSFKRKHHLCEV